MHANVTNHLVNVGDTPTTTDNGAGSSIMITTWYDYYSDKDGGEGFSGSCFHTQFWEAVGLTATHGRSSQNVEWAGLRQRSSSALSRELHFSSFVYFGSVPC